MPQGEERGEHRPPDGRQRIVTEVDGVQLEELREGVLGNVLYLVVAHVQHLDALHRRHRDLDPDSIENTSA